MQVPVFFEAVIVEDLRVQAPDALYVIFPALAFVFTPVNTAFNVVLFPRAKILALLAVGEAIGTKGEAVGEPVAGLDP